MATPAHPAACIRPFRRLVAAILFGTVAAPFPGADAQAFASMDAIRTPAREANTITMLPSSRVNPGASVLLGDIAALEGTLAKSLAGVVIVSAADAAMTSPLEISISRLRSALASFDSTLEGRVLVNGATTRVWISPVPIAAPAQSPIVAVAPSLSNGPTVRDAVIEKVAGVLGIPVSSVAATFEPQDAEFLAMGTAGRTVAASPTGTGERIGVMVRVYERDRVVASQSLRVGVAIRRTCAVVSTPLDRGAAISSTSFTLEEREISPSQIIADPATLVGRSARSRLAPGRIIESRDVESPVVVSRGDIVTVECLSGGILLKTFGRARGSGREGDIVSFEPLRKGRAFEARIAGPGRAVALVDGDAAPQIVAEHGGHSGTGLASAPMPQRASQTPAVDRTQDSASGFLLVLP